MDRRTFFKTVAAGIAAAVPVAAVAKTPAPDYEIKRLVAMWKRLYGDPNDPQVAARIHVTAAAINKRNHYDAFSVKVREMLHQRRRERLLDFSPSPRTRDLVGHEFFKDDLGELLSCASLRGCVLGSSPLT